MILNHHNRYLTSKKNLKINSEGESSYSSITNENSDENNNVFEEITNSITNLQKTYYITEKNFENNFFFKQIITENQNNIEMNVIKFKNKELNSLAIAENVKENLLETSNSKENNINNNTITVQNTTSQTVDSRSNDSSLANKTK
jgi:hypothetical protein